MVVVEDRYEAVANDMVQLAAADIDGKDGMDACEYRDVQLCLEEAPKSEGGQSSSRAARCLFSGRFWEVRLYSGQSTTAQRLERRRWPESPLTSISFSSSSLLRRVPPAFSLRL